MPDEEKRFGPFGIIEERRILTRISLHYLFAVSVLTLYGGQV